MSDSRATETLTNPTAEPAPILRASKLGKAVAFSDTSLTILHDVSFQIHRGETLAIVGASGSGKSTLLSLLAGLDAPSSGEVHLAETALYRLDEDGRAALRAKRVGFVFQSFQLMPALTALENVMLPMELQGRADARDTARHWLGEVGLGARIGHTPRQLSGGEQQRVALARAFAPGPDLVFADEPTGNLDTATGLQIIDLMFGINRSQQTTLVLVTHDSELASRCDRRLHLTAGQVTGID